MGKRSNTAITTILAASLLMAMSAHVHAWDGAVTGRVSAYEIAALETGGHNYDFRVHLEGVSTMCSGGAGSWAYINTDAGNYKATVAALLAAHATGKSVTIWTNRSAQDYCQIGHLMMRP